MEVLGEGAVYYERGTPVPRSLLSGLCTVCSAAVGVPCPHCPNSDHGTTNTRVPA